MRPIGLLATGDGRHLRRLAEAFARCGRDTVRLDPTLLWGAVGAGPPLRAAGQRSDGSVPGGTRRPSGDQDLMALDALVVRIIPPGSLDQIIFRIDCLHLLADGGLPVINTPRALERTIDKHWCSQLLQRAGIPTPRTITVESFDDAMRAFREIGDMIVKPLLGSGGRGIVRVSDKDLAYRTFRALEMARAVYYLQEFVPHGRFDLRLFVVGDAVVAAVKRVGDGWKTNVASGASAERHDPDPEERDLALRACRSVGADYAGVDIVRALDGRALVIEVNGIPGWAALERATGSNPAAAIAHHVLRRIEEVHGT